MCRRANVSSGAKGFPNAVFRGVEEVSGKDGVSKVAAKAAVRASSIVHAKISRRQIKRGFVNDRHGHNAQWLPQGYFLWYIRRMTHSTVTDKFQTTIPLEIRRAMKLSPRQKVAYEMRSDGSAVMRPIPRLDDLFGSLSLQKPVASSREEKQAARAAMAREAASKGLK